MMGPKKGKKSRLEAECKSHLRMKRTAKLGEGDEFQDHLPVQLRSRETRKQKKRRSAAKTARGGERQTGDDSIYLVGGRGHWGGTYRESTQGTSDSSKSKSSEAR